MQDWLFSTAFSTVETSSYDLYMRREIVREGMKRSDIDLNNNYLTKELERPFSDDKNFINNPRSFPAEGRRGSEGAPRGSGGALRAGSSAPSYSRWTRDPSRPSLILSKQNARPVSKCVKTLAIPIC